MKTKPKKRWLGNILRWLVPLSISGIAFWLILRDIKLSDLSNNLTRIGLPVLVLAILAYLTSFLTRCFCWFILLRKKVTFKNAFFTMGAGYLLNNLFPFRLGEIGRAVLLDEPGGVSGFEVLSSILVERIFDVFLASVFVLATLPRILGDGFDQTIIVVAMVLAVVGIAVLYLMARFRARIIVWLTPWGERYPFMDRWVLPKLNHILEGLSVLNKPGPFLLAFTSLAISWFIAFGKHYVIFNRLFPLPPFWWMVFALSAGTFGAAIPSAPAGLGVFHGVMVAAFALLGVGADVAFTHALVTHALAFVFANIIGLVGLRLRGEAIVDFFHRVIQRSPEVKSVE